MLQLCFRFDEFELDTESCELLRSGHHVKLERIPMQLLVLLLENPGKLVRREAIIEKLWGSNVFVEAEHSINTAVNKLRAILRDDSRNPRFIRTVVGQGYCFIAKVDVLEPVEARAHESSSGAADRQEIFHDLPSMLDNKFLVNSSTEEEPVESIDDPETIENKPDLQDASTVTIKKPSHSKVWMVAGFIGSLAALLIVVAIIYLPRRPEKVTQSQPEAGALHSVAVLPFRNLAQTSEQDYLVDGMTDQLTTNLARRTSLRVISQRSAMQYKGIQKPIQEIARALNVDAIVEGSYLRAGKQVRITAQLLDAHNDQHLWAQTYDESDKDLLAMQDQVTNDIAQQVAIALGSQFTRSKLRTANPRAREAYLRGRYFWNERTLAALTNSVKYYTVAIREDPTYADAYAALAEAYVLVSVYGGPDPSVPLWKAQYAAERALDLDSSLGEAHTALGAVKTDRDWDWAGAEKEYQRALQLNPDDPTAHHWYSLHLSRLGRTREAEIEIQRALALDPLSFIINTDAAETAYWARNPNEARTRVEAVLALNPNFAEAHLVKGKILEQLHQYKDAEAEFQTAKGLFGGGANIDALQAHAMALGGERAEALKAVQRLESEPLQAYVSGVDIGEVYCGLQQTDDAMKWLNLAYQRRDKGIDIVGIDPLFDGCRSDPRFNNLLNQLRLTPSKLPN
jgi:TolB-like protein/DNA-binding winged helix-turn-helix (wHTH) protein/Flp pilus assembly protein TadD